MTIETFDTALKFGEFRITQQRFDLREVSETTGALRERLLAPPRWRLVIGQPTPGIPYSEAAIWKTLILRLRGGVNNLAAYDVAQPAPRGTMRGTLTLTASVAIGSNTISFTGGAGQAGRTILRGDWLQVGTGIGSHYVSATADATASGAGTITGLTVEPPFRLSYAIGASVTWDKPVAHYKMLSSSNGMAYSPGALLISGYGAEFIENWTV